MSTSGSGQIVPNSPIVNLGYLYINGANLSFLTGTTMSVGAGQVRDSTDTTDIIIGGNLYDAPNSNPPNYAAEAGTTNPVTISSAVTINTAIIGAGGIDQGTIANSTNYAVYVIGDSRGFNSGSALISANFTTPSLPLGYDCFRQVGAVLTSGAAALLDFTSRTVARDYFYGASIATAVTAGSAVTFTAVALTSFIPSNATGVYLLVALTADAGGTRTASFRATGSSSAAGQVTVSAPASTTLTYTIFVPVTNTAGVMSIDYLVSNALASVSIRVAGYTTAS